MDFGSMRRSIAGKVLWLHCADIINDYFTKDTFVRPGICYIHVFVRQTFLPVHQFLFLNTCFLQNKH